MGKRLFLLVMGSFVGTLVSPLMSWRALTAADDVVMKQPDFRAAETIELVPKEKALSEQTAAQITQTAQASQAVQLTKATKIDAPINYTVTINTPTMVVHGLSYTDIYKTGKLLYAHNSSGLFGGLGKLTGGTVFYVTEAGVQKAYRVTTAVLYDKTEDGFLNHDEKLMGNIVYTALGHDVALMTCAGVSYGDGDAAQRLVVFADAV